MESLFMMMDGTAEEFLVNAPFLGAVIGFIIVASLLDLGLKGWALWRAARMRKAGWFIALLVVNSLGIFPGLYLLATNAEYKKLGLAAVSAAPKRGRKPGKKLE